MRSLVRQFFFEDFAFAEQPRRITADKCWAEVERLVYDNSSLERLHSCNHSLQHVFGLPVEAMTPQLWNAFHINGQSGYDSSTPRPKFLQKLFHAIYADRGNEFDIAPFVDYDVKLMPFVLSLAAMRFKIDCLYELIKQWNVAELFGFPSPEKERLSAKMSNIETENIDLRNEVKLLKQEVARLASENGKLKSEAMKPGKRARTGDD